MLKHILTFLLLVAISTVTAQTLQPTSILITKLSLVKKVSNKTTSSTNFSGTVEAAGQSMPSKIVSEVFQTIE